MAEIAEIHAQGLQSEPSVGRCAGPMQAVDSSKDVWMAGCCWRAKSSNGFRSKVAEIPSRHVISFETFYFREYKK